MTARKQSTKRTSDMVAFSEMHAKAIELAAQLPAEPPDEESTDSDKDE